MRNVTQIQQWLIGEGYLAPKDDEGRSNDDGKFGVISLAAYNRARAAKGLPPHAGVLTLVEINRVLFPEEQPAPPPLKPNFLQTLSLAREALNLLKGKPMNSKWLSSFVGTTAFKYLVAMLATYLAGKLGLDPVEGKATIEGVLSQLVGVAMGAWGMWESSRNKIVLDGKKVSVSDLDPADKSAVKAIVASTK